MFLLADDLADLRRELDAADSATAVLQARCEAMGLPGGPTVRAKVELRAVLEAGDPSVEPGVRDHLRAGRREALACRRIRLVWGDLVLSQAVNWYRPERLTADMRSRLLETDEPFGVVARPLAYRRIRLETRLDEGRGRTPMLSCRAILETPDGEPLALVDEIYLGG